MRRTSKYLIYHTIIEVMAVSPRVRLSSRTVRRSHRDVPIHDRHTETGELGTDFSKWPTVKHFSSWLGLCPNFKKTGGKVQSSKTRRGKGRAAHALRLAAWSLMRSQSYPGAYLRCQRSRLGAPKAITATAHKLGRIVYHLMKHREAYVREQEEAYAAEVRARQEKQLHRRARELGYVVLKVEPEAEPASPTTAIPQAGE